MKLSMEKIFSLVGGAATMAALGAAVFLCSPASAQTLSDSRQHSAINFNQYYDGSNLVAKTTGYSGMIYVNTATGGFIIESGGTNTAGSTVTKSQLITITASGYVGIGWPTPSQELECADQINVTDLTGAYYLAGNKIMHQPASDPTSFAVGAGALASQTVTNLYNTAVGYQALNSLTTADGNTAVGYQALKSTTTGKQTALGYQALTANTTGYANTAVGSLALSSNTTGSYNVAYGYSALAANTTGSYNVAVGANALKTLDGSDYNVAIGYNCLNNSGGNPLTGSSNVAAGSNAGTQLTTGNNNVIIGCYVGSTTLSTGSNNILIGTSSQVDAPTSGTSNFLSIGNLYSIWQNITRR